VVARTSATSVAAALIACFAQPTAVYARIAHTLAAVGIILTRRASEGSALEPLLARRVSMDRLPSHRKPL
jgi:hypothetical protein